MDKTTCIFGLLGLAALCFAYTIHYAIREWRKKPSTTSTEFGSDDPAPPRTLEFNQRIIAACGSSLTHKQKLDMLTLPDITIAKALVKAREILESPPTVKAVQP